MPPAAISAVRTLAIASLIGFVLVRKPLRVGQCRGVMTVFNALRPSVAIYVLALILEQLVHTCVVLGDEHDAEAHGALRRGVYHVISIFLMISGFLRAKNPRSESDIPFLLTMCCLLAIAVLPPPANARTGPLCQPTSLLGAGERVLRALLFAAVYVVLVYSAAPNRNISNELFICVARATAASIWVLGVVVVGAAARARAGGRRAVHAVARQQQRAARSAGRGAAPLLQRAGAAHGPRRDDARAWRRLGRRARRHWRDAGRPGAAQARARRRARHRSGVARPRAAAATASRSTLRRQAAAGLRATAVASGLNGAAVAAVLAREAACGSGGGGGGV